MKEKLTQIILNNEVTLMKSFDNYSLLINASEIAKEHYHRKPHNTQVNPIGNIPYEYRVAIEATKIYKGKQLVKVYDTETKTSATEDYFIRGISICDALLEDIYEVLLLNEDPQITDGKLEKEVSFYHNKLPMVLLSYMPEHKNNKGLEEVTIEDYFLQYNIYRQLRHAIIHNNGKLKERHKRSIRSTCEKIKIRTGQEYSIESIPFVKNNKVIVNMELMCIFRMFQLEMIAQLNINLTQ